MKNAAPPPFDPAEVNDPALVVEAGPGSDGPAVLRAQVLLDRANFSPGEIDAEYGTNLQVAVLGFQASRGLEQTGTVDPPTWAALNADTSPVITPYTIAPEDVAGPFVKVPRDMMAKAELQFLGYESPLELLGEKFHTSPKILRWINPRARFDRAGEQILAPSVAGPPPASKAAVVVVTGSTLSVAVFDQAGHLMAQFPATVGSEHDPLPVGGWKVKGIRRKPAFRYNPDLFWDADPDHSKATIAPGPNNPVGLVWIDLSKQHYGIHGTPEPSKIGHTESHGCIRLTNWDALRLASMVQPGTPVILKE